MERTTTDASTGTRKRPVHLPWLLRQLVNIVCQIQVLSSLDALHRQRLHASLVLVLSTPSNSDSVRSASVSSSISTEFGAMSPTHHPNAIPPSPHSTRRHHRRFPLTSIWRRWTRRLLQRYTRLLHRVWIICMSMAKANVSIRARSVRSIQRSSTRKSNARSSRRKCFPLN